MSEAARCAIVTGAAQGLGLAISRLLHEKGVRVLMADLSADKLEEAVRTVAAAEGHAIGRVVDVTQPEEVASMASEAEKAFGRIDILVNNAGGAGPKTVQDIDAIDDETWDSVVERNLKSAFLCARAVVPVMRRQRYGRIVNVSSNTARGRKGPVGTAGARLPYAAAKAGLLGFTSQLAKDVAADGITVNAVMPSLTLSEPGSRIRSKFEAMDEAARTAFLSPYPMGRAADADEVAAAVVFLASEAASYVSGVALPIDGAAS